MASARIARAAIASTVGNGGDLRGGRTLAVLAIDGGTDRGASDVRVWAGGESETRSKSTSGLPVSSTSSPEKLTSMPRTSHAETNA